MSLVIKVILVPCPREFRYIAVIISKQPIRQCETSEVVHLKFFPYITDLHVNVYFTGRIHALRTTPMRRLGPLLVGSQMGFLAHHLLHEPLV